MMSQNKNAIGDPVGMIPFNSREPTFIIRRESKEICKANDEAISGCNNQNPIGKKIENIIHIEQNVSHSIIPAYFNQEWFLLKQETLLWEGSEHFKVRLERRDGIPDFDVMKSLKNMIGFLLHRVRSPLTGIQGYAELLETNTNIDDIDEGKKYLDKINSGIEELFDLLNGLHTLQKISLERVNMNSFSANPDKIIKDIISNYPEKLKKNINYKEQEKSPSVQCNPGDMQRILSYLIENAIEHAPAEEYPVSILQPSPNSIKVTHSGNPIPESIAEQLFYPFVTTKARKLGIGLTMALLYAKRYNGSIFLTDNNPFREISFSLCLPPRQKYQSVSLL